MRGEALRNGQPVPTTGGLCLQLVRLVVEDAYRLPSHGLYRWRTHAVDGHLRASADPYARDMEKSLREAGMAVSQPYQERYVVLSEADLEPGDLLFRWDTAKDRNGVYVGHVGIYMPGDFVLENINPALRPTAMKRGATALTPLGTWPVTTVIRFDPYKVA